MARIIYSASKKDFFLDWSMHRLVDKMVEGAVFNHIGYSPSELNSWHANVNSIASLLFLADKVSKNIGEPSFTLTNRHKIANIGEITINPTNVMVKSKKRFKKCLYIIL